MGLVYIVSLHQTDARKIHNQLVDLKIDANPLEFEFLRPMQIPDKLETDVDLIIFNNPHVLNIDMKQQILSWRKKGFLSPILMLTRVNSEKDIIEMQGLNSFVLLEKPYVEKDLVGIASKLLKTTQAAQRKYRRFSADQMVHLTSYKTEYKAETRVNNISLGGLCIQGACAELKVGDLLHMNFNMDRLNSERMMSGRVVWVQAGKEPSAGVEFVKDKEVYGHLMKSIG